jgi:hypothetical protein
MTALAITIAYIGLPLLFAWMAVQRAKRHG